MTVFLSVLKWSAIVGAATLVLAALKPALDRRYSPRWRYVLWLALALALVLSPVRWGKLLPAPAEPLVTVEVPQVEVAVGGESGLTFRQPEARQPVEPAASTPARPNQSGSQTRDPVHSAAPAETTKPEKILSLGTLATAVWIAGAAAFALWHLAGTVWFSRRARRWSKPADQNTVRIYNEVRREMGLNGSPRLRISAAVDSPMVLGLFQPRLLLPDEWYSDRELKLILRHELTHYRRRDLWYKLVVLSANAVHWFNPLAYLLRREAEATLELLCDEAAVAGEDRKTRQVYCEVLLSSVHRQKGLQRAVLSTHFYGGASVMRERFKNLLSGPGRKFGWAALAAVLSATVLCACTLAFAQTGDQENGGNPEEGTPLSQEEIDLWQERLESEEWNGFVTNMYSDVRRLSLLELLYNGAGISRGLTDGELAAFVEEYEDEPQTDIFAIDVADMEAYLEEHTGYEPEDFASGLAEFSGLEGFPDMVYLYHGDTNYTGVEVAGGTKTEDTVELEVHAGAVNGNVGTLTIRDGKVVSFTNDLYTAVENMAWDRVDRVAAAVDAQGAGQVRYRTLRLYNLGTEPLKSGDRTYQLYPMDYRLYLDQIPDDTITVEVDGQTLPLIGRGGNCIWEDSDMNTVLVVSVDGDGNVRPERFLTGAEADPWMGKWDNLLREIAGSSAIFTADRFESEPYACVQELLIRLTDGKDFSVRLRNGQNGAEEDLQISAENGTGVCDVGHLIHQTYTWETVTEEEWNEASPTVVLNIQGDGPAHLMCRNSGNLLAMTEGGETWWYCRAVPEAGGQSLYEALLSAAREAMADTSALNYVNQVYAAIVGTEGFTIRATADGQSNAYSGADVWNIDSTLTDGQVTEVTAADWRAVSDPGTEFAITDGVRTIRCRTADNLAEVTERGGARYFRMISQGNSACDCLRYMAEEAAGGSVFYGGSASGTLPMAEAARQLAEGIAQRMRALPDWVAWKPADFQVESAEVFDAYLGQPQQFCANISFYLKLADDDISSEARGYWETGSGLSGPIASGRYAGYYGYGRECLATKNSAGDWVISGLGTGGCSVNLPGWTLSAGMGNYLGNASVSDLVDMFFLTEGRTHDYLLPMHISEEPEAELESVLAGLPQAKAQALREALAAYQAEYGGIN